MVDRSGNMFPTFTEGEFHCDFHKCYERGNYMNILVEYQASKTLGPMYFPSTEKYWQFCEWSVKVIFEGKDCQLFIPTEDLIQT